MTINLKIFIKGPSGSPQNLNAVPLSSRSLEITWDPPSAELQNGLIRMYSIGVTTQETGRRQNFTTLGSITRLVVENLSPFYRYECEVLAITLGPGPLVSTVAQLHQEGMSLKIAIFQLTRSIFVFQPLQLVQETSVLLTIPQYLLL